VREPLRPIVEGWSVLSRDYYRQYKGYWYRMVTYGFAIGAGLGEFMVHR
jgi:hypothetical protein